MYTILHPILNVDLNTFFYKGYIHGKMPFDVSALLDDCYFIDCNSYDVDTYKHPPKVVDLLNQIEQKLTEMFVKPIFSNFEFRFSGIWSGVDPGSARWHNDFEDGNTFNSNILIYLDDNEPYGNYIAVTDQKSEPIIIQPKRNEFVWLNQRKNFLHKAHHHSGPRRVCSFDYMIFDLLY